MFNHIFGSRDVCDARNSGRIVNEMALSFSYVLSGGKFIHIGTGQLRSDVLPIRVLERAMRLNIPERILT